MGWALGGVFRHYNAKAHDFTGFPCIWKSLESFTFSGDVWKFLEISIFCADGDFFCLELSGFLTLVSQKIIIVFSFPS